MIESALMAVASDHVSGVSKDAGSHNVNDETEQRSSMAIMLLKRPSLSANRPGTQRPKQLPALNMAIIW